MPKPTWVTTDWDNGPLQDTLMPQFQACMGNRDGIGQTQGNAEIPCRFAGTLGNLTIRMGLNQFDCRWAVHISGVDSALTIEGVSPATGWLSNTTDRVAVSATDEIAFRASVLSGTGFDRFDNCQMEFVPDGPETITWVAGQNRFGIIFQNDSDVEIFSAMGLIDTGTQATTEITVREAGRMESGFVTASANTRGSDSTVSNRINGSVGSIAITVTGGMTGQFSDTSGSDTFSAGDAINWENENFTGGGAWTAITVASFFARTVECWEPMVREVSGHTQNFNQTFDNPLGGTWKGTSQDDSFAVQVRTPQTFTRTETDVSANTLDGEAEQWVAVNSSAPGDSPSLIQIPAGMTGRFESRDEQRCATGDNVRVRTAGHGSAGSWTRRNQQCLQSDPVDDPLELEWTFPVTEIAGGGG